MSYTDVRHVNIKATCGDCGHVFHTGPFAVTAGTGAYAAIDTGTHATDCPVMLKLKVQRGDAAREALRKLISFLESDCREFYIPLKLNDAIQQARKAL